MNALAERAKPNICQSAGLGLESKPTIFDPRAFQVISISESLILDSSPVYLTP
jgi:hypothetical protein